MPLRSSHRGRLQRSGVTAMLTFDSYHGIRKEEHTNLRRPQTIISGKYLPWGDSLLLKPQSDHYLDLGIAVKRHWTAILDFAVESKLLIGT